MTFRHLTLFGISSALVASAFILPIQPVDAATLMSGLDPFPMHDFLAGHKQKRQQQGRNRKPAAPAYSMLTLAPEKPRAATPRKMAAPTRTTKAALPVKAASASIASAPSATSAMSSAKSSQSNAPLAPATTTATTARALSKKPATASSSYRATSGAYAFPAVAERHLAAAPQAVTPTVLRSKISLSNDVELTLSKARVINLDKPAGRVSISDPTVASAVIISPTQIQLVGLKVGVANLLIWDDPNSNDHRTVDISVQRDVSVLAKQLKFIDPRIEIMPMAAEDTVILNGEVNGRETAQLAVEIAKAHFTGQGGSSGGGGLPSSSGGSGGGIGQQGPSSLAPGTALPGATPNIINLLRIQGEPQTKAALVRKKLAEIDPNIQMDIIPGPGGQEKVVLTGRVRTAGIISRAINTTAVFYGQPGLKVVTGPGGNGMRQEPPGSTEFQNAEKFNSNLDVNILQGSVITDTSGNVVSMMQVAIKPQVKCSIKFLDVSKSALKQLGSNFLSNWNAVTVGSFSGSQAPASGKNIASLDPEDTGGLVAEQASRNLPGVSTRAARSVTSAFGINPVYGDGVTQFITINQQIGAAISALSENRKVRTLAEPTLTMLSGEKASFLAGGEIPIPVSGANGQITVEYHEFGIRLNIVATVNDDGKIHLQVAPEISSVDNSNVVTTNIVTFPGFRTRRMQSTLEVLPGQSVVLAGLFNQEETQSLSGLPGIGQMPIIGSLFRNKWSDRRDNEMVVIIRPEVVMMPSPEDFAGAAAPIDPAPEKLK